MNPHGFGLVDLFGALAVVGLVGVAVALLACAVERLINAATGSGGLLGPRSRRERRRG